LDHSAAARHGYVGFQLIEKPLEAAVSAKKTGTGRRKLDHHSRTMDLT